jgi:L-glyceraldehyde 3-phosphate reductase
VNILSQKGIKCLIHQPKYSMFDRWIEPELIEVLARNAIGCIPFSPLAQGLLTNRYLEGIPDNSRASKPHGFLKPDQITEDKINKVKKLNKIAQSRGQSLAQMALAWVLRLPVVTSALVGASSIEQISDNVNCIKNLNFTKEEMKDIDNILSEKTV